MAIDQIVAQLDAEIARLTHVRNILTLEPAQPEDAAVVPRASSEAAEKPGRPKGRHMSAAARRRISEMMKKRWAERRKKQK